MKQSTLSRKVKDMEIRLGIKLFERTTRGAEVTENGRVFIEQARRIVTDVENLQTTARNVSYGLQGRLAVGYCSSLMSGNLKLAFSDYLARFPEVQFDGIEGSPEKIIHGLQSQTMDVGVAPISLNEDGLLSKPLWSERLFVAVLDESELASKDKIYWQDLRREVFVVSSNGIGPILGNLISARLTEQGFRPAVIYQDTSQESVLSMIAAKRFISIATEASQGVPWQDLRFREIYDGNGPARLDYALYWREDNDNPALKRFFKMIEERQPAADPRGFAGLQDGTDYHWGGVLKAALVSTLLGAGAELGSGDDGNLARAFRRGTQDSINRAGEQIVSRELNVRPTLTIRPGFPVRVMVTRDLVIGGER